MKRGALLKNARYLSLILFPLLAIIILALPIAFALPHILTTSGLPILLFVCLPFTLMAIILLILVDLLQRLRGNVHLAKRKYLYLANVLLSLGIICTALFFVYSLYNEKPPQFFPFDDKEATYTITKDNNLYWIHYSSPSRVNSFFTCEDTEGKRTCRKEIDQDVTSMIASSPVALEQFMGKKVKVSGEFISTNKQCIVNICKTIGNWAALRIDTISLAK